MDPELFRQLGGGSALTATERRRERLARRKTAGRNGPTGTTRVANRTARKAKRTASKRARY
jgi:hypothetical protein